MRAALTDLKSRARGISLGLYAADLGGLRGAAKTAAGWGCEIAHFDEMDGNFVPAMIGGPAFVGAVGQGLLRDVHLMVARPSRLVPAYVKAGVDMITVHAEAPDAGDAIRIIREVADSAGRPVLAGLGLFPGTPLDAIGGLLDMAPDMILVLSLDPRTGAAPDIAGACERLGEIRHRCTANNPVLAFDGGVTTNTIDQIAAAQPDMIVSGSAVLKSDDPAQTYKSMRATWLVSAARTDAT